MNSENLKKGLGASKDTLSFDGRTLRKMTGYVRDEWVFDGVSIQKKTGPSSDDLVMDSQVLIIDLAVVIGIID